MNGKATFKIGGKKIPRWVPIAGVAGIAALFLMKKGNGGTTSGAGLMAEEFADQLIRQREYLEELILREDRDVVLPTPATPIVPVPVVPIKPKAPKNTLGGTSIAAYYPSYVADTPRFGVPVAYMSEYRATQHQEMQTSIVAPMSQYRATVRVDKPKVKAPMAKARAKARQKKDEKKIIAPMSQYRAAQHRVGPLDLTSTQLRADAMAAMKELIS